MYQIRRKIGPKVYRLQNIEYMLGLITSDNLVSEKVTRQTALEMTDWLIEEGRTDLRKTMDVYIIFCYTRCGKSQAENLRDKNVSRISAEKVPTPYVQCKYFPPITFLQSCYKV